MACAAHEPVAIYLQTRRVAADITAGTLAALAGWVFFSQFTPGSISAGSSFAQVLAKEQAVAEFALGDALGRWYFSVFPVEPSLPVMACSLVAVMAILAIVSAFSGFIHDPIQKTTGIHGRRLAQLLNAIEESMQPLPGKGYCPKDTFVGRIYDVVDWLKGLLTF